MGCDGLQVAMISFHSCPLATLGGRETGGMNIYVRELSRELARLGCSVDIFTRLKRPGVPEVVQVGERVRVIHLKAGPAAPCDKSTLPKFFPEFTQRLLSFAAREERRYDLIHTHYWLSGMVGYKVGRIWRVPVVHTSHTLGAVKNLMVPSIDGEPEERVEGEWKVLSSVDAVVATTPQERLQLRSLYAVSPQRVWVIPCGVSLKLFKPGDQVEAKSRLGVGEELLVLYVGRAEPIKGLDMLVRAFWQCARDGEFGTRLCLYIIGGDQDEEECCTNGELLRLREMVFRLGLSDSVCFAGPLPQEELPVYYRAADVCVLPSRYESFGIVALESMACGTPVVASHVGGLSYILQQGRTGFLVPRDDYLKFGDAMRLLLEDRSLRQRMGEQGVMAVQAFDWSKVAKRMMELYAALTSPCGAKGLRRRRFLHTASVRRVCSVG